MIRSTAQQQAENVQSAIFDLIRQLRQRQEGLEEDQQLLVYCGTGSERIQVHEIVLPNNDTVILNGVDGEGNPASLFVTLNNVEITSKVIRLLPPAKPLQNRGLDPSAGGNLLVPYRVRGLESWRNTTRRKAATRIFSPRLGPPCPLGASNCRNDRQQNMRWVVRIHEHGVFGNAPTPVIVQRLSGIRIHVEAREVAARYVQSDAVPRL
jgi:hypothetical protein